MFARSGFVLVLMVLLPATSLRGQSPDEDQVRRTVVQLFDAMRAGDGTALAALFHPDASLKSVVVAGGETRVQMGEVAAFAAQVGSPRAEIWDERIANLEVRVDGPLATAWMDYSFYVGGRFSHCGVNAFQLARLAAGWRILDITDTRRTTDCRAD